MKKDEKEACGKLRELLKDVVERNNAEALLLSGGLDTSILAALANDHGKSKKALTVALTGTRAPDLGYAQKVAQKFRYEHHLICLSETEALDKLPEVIKAVRSFDPALPNDLTIYVALQEAKNLGIKSVMTGDGADELFAGYSYMHELSPDTLDKYIKAISKTMWFSSNKLGASLDVEIKQPYRDKKIVDFALEIDPGLKVKEINGRKYGKWLLRKAFEEELGEVAWRAKEPIEFGSGTTKLRAIISGKISNEEYEQKKQDYGMEFMNKEHLFFYELYKAVVGGIPKSQVKGKGKECPLCNAELPENRHHCYICGFSYPLGKYLGEADT
ncbi:MAG: 7-cyano-7-deazaguanine synthase [Methanosarcinales archaeon]|nr:7-cyano-7-deazaguanine synthase [Methanosarcinales archaeon]